jgi:CRP-like cAMP-binding protein
MKHQTLIQIFNSITTLSPALEERLISIIKQRYYAKGDFLLAKGNICRKIFFLNEGLCRAYYVVDNKEYTTWFMDRNDIVISVSSFLQQQPSQENIQALEACDTLYITWQDLQHLYNDFIEFNIIGRKIIEVYYIKSEERASSLRSHSAAERYKDFIAKTPNLLQKAALGQIASHLGISQETLSRLRSRK